MKRPFAHIGFSMAISLIVLNLLPYNFVLPIFVGLAIIFVASLALSKFRQAITVPLCVGTALFACLLFVLVLNSTVLPQLNLDGHSANATFYIVDIPEVTENEYTYTINVKELLINGAPQNIKMRLKTNFLIDAKPYQLLNARINMYAISDKAFSSYGYWGDDVFLSAKTDFVLSTKQFVRGPSALLYGIRKSAINALSANIPGDEGAISTALVTGYRSLLSNRLKMAFSSAGASHIMAVSGFHLVMVVGFFAFILKKIRLNERISAILTIMVVLAFVGFTGYSKSIIRAGVMMLVMLLGKLFNRRADTLNSLGLAVFIICFNPFAVADVGTQLSVASTLSLIIIQPLFMSFSLNKFSQGLIELVSIPLSVMIFTSPIMYLFFGYITAASLLSNVFISVLGSISLALSFVSLLMLEIGFLPSAFASIVTCVNKQMIKIVYAFASFNGSKIQASSLFGIALAGACIIFAFVYLTGRLNMLKIASISSSVIMIVAVAASMIVGANSASLMVLDNGSMALKYKNEAVIYCPNSNCDYNRFISFVDVNGSTVDVVVADEYTDELESFVTEYGCDYLVINDIDGSATYSTNENSIQIKTFKNDEMSYCLLGVNNVTIVNGKNISSNCDIQIKNGIAKDYNGKIDLDDGSVVYTINNGNFKARRVDAWQK